MPDDKFPYPKPKEEFTVEQLENLLAVTLASGVTLEGIKSAEYLAFITTPEWNIVIDVRKNPFDLTHDRLFARLGLEKDQCLIYDGNFKIDWYKMNLLCFYTSTQGKEKVKNIKEASENKIRKYLISKGVQIKPW